MNDNKSKKFVNNSDNESPIIMAISQDVLNKDWDNEVDDGWNNV